MAKQIDKGKVKMGRLLRVWNQKRKFGSANSYYAVWVEDEKGGNERCILLTESELTRAVQRANANKEDLTERGIITDLLD